MRPLRSVFVFVLIGLAAPAEAVDVMVLSPSPQARFASAEIGRALSERMAPSAYRTIRLQVVSDPEEQGLRPEGFAIDVVTKGDRRDILIVGGDSAGLLYGGLEVAEIIRTRGIEAIKEDRQNPYMAMRGTKFNIPLDLRTPSYTDPCDAAQINIPEMWSFAFWKNYIDSLARHRYNYISLWSLHPFPSMVKVPGYEDVALDDVWRSKNISRQTTYSLSTVYPLSEEIMADVEVVKRMTIDEKIKFWRRVMAYGKSRNVEFYVVTWNIFDHGTFGKYGITDKADNPTTIDYFRKSVKQMFVTYPDLAGIGLTTGENMPKLSTPEKEDWAFATYGQGVLDAAKEMPERKFKLIHRQHQTGAKDIAERFKPVVEQPNVEFIFSFKYAKAHVMSATTQPYHERFVEDITANGLKTIWTLRNDSNYHFRWGAPDFVREFIQNIPHDVSRGYYYGSDGFTWGRDFLPRNVEGEHPIAIDRHWFHWMLWGRLGYDPELSNDRFRDVIAQRFELDEEDAGRLLRVWQAASLVYPTVTGFHWGSLDFQWNIEGCQSQPGYAQNKTGFHDVNRFINLPPHPCSGNQSIPDYVKMVMTEGSTDLRTPLEVAEKLKKLAERAAVTAMRFPSGDNEELGNTLADIFTMAALGLYYSHKIRGATEVALFRETKEEEHRLRAIDALTRAAVAWTCYAEWATGRYKNPLWTNRVGMIDWKKNYAYVLEDIRIAGGDPEELELPAAIDVENEPIERKW